MQHDPVYQRLFPQAFPGKPDLYTLANVTKAIAAFERTIVSMRSPYDRYRWGGDSCGHFGCRQTRRDCCSPPASAEAAFDVTADGTSAAVRFEGCRIEERGKDPRGGFFNTGVSDYAAPNRGLYEHTQRAEDLGKFRAPSLAKYRVTASLHARWQPGHTR